MLKHEIPRDAAAISYSAWWSLSRYPGDSRAGRCLSGWMELHGTVVQLIIDLFPDRGYFSNPTLKSLPVHP